jgi:hypothetical protein
MDKWISYYQDILKPSLLLGTFRFVNDFLHACEGLSRLLDL